MFNDFLDRMSHIHRLLNVNQFIQQSTQPDGGGTISTTTGTPARSGVMLGGAKGISTYAKKERTLTTPEVLGAMSSLKEKGVKYLGSWNPDPNDKEVPPEKQALQLDAVSQHTRKTVYPEFKKRTQEKAAYDIDAGETIDNPYYKNPEGK
jgi:hypothetical protein